MPSLTIFDLYAFTFGELIDMVKAYHERRRRENKDRSVIAFTQAQLTGIAIGGSNKKYECHEVFPYWTEEEKTQITVEKYKRLMFEQVIKTKGIGKEEGN